VQEAAQNNSTVQSLGSSAQLATALETPPGSASTSQLTSTITQIQVGCLSACFGTTTTDPSTAALTQLLLSQLSSLLPPSGSSDLQSVPATEQNAVQQVACQLQQTGTVGTQVQTASQTNATVQVLAGLPADLGSAQPGGSTVDQTEQQTWQLQIGCLFYCVDSQQVQQAQQSTTTIQIVPGPSGSTLAVVQQTIWQMQIGCLAWCWNSSQLQQATTVAVVVTEPAPAPPPDPTPVTTAPPAQAAPVSSGPAPAPAVAAAGPPAGPPAVPPAPPASAAGGSAMVSLAAPLRLTGLAVLGRWSRPAVAAPAKGSSPAIVGRASASIDAIAERVDTRLVARQPSPPQHRLRQRPAQLSANSPQQQVLIEPSGDTGDPILVLMLVAAVAVPFAAVVSRKKQR
jgi:hypothetical protein